MDFCAISQLCGLDFWEGDGDGETKTDLLRDKEAVELCRRADERFKNFVTSFLLRRDETTDVHTFHLCPYFDHDSDPQMVPFVRNALTYVVKHNLNKLILGFPDNNRISLPNCLFTCQSLEELHMFGSELLSRAVIKPKKVHLPRLKKLDLYGTDFLSNHFEKLLSGCPLLESLSIENCVLEMNNFASQSLKWLQVVGVEFITRSVSSTLSICAPALENLEFYADMDTVIQITLREISKLIRAKISVGLCHKFRYTSDLLSSNSNVGDHEVESLYHKEMLERELIKCPTFNSLKVLNLEDDCMCCAFDAWYNLVKHCPNLERLTLSHTEEFCDHEDDYRHNRNGSRNLELIDGGHPLSLVRITYNKFDYAVEELVQLIMEMTQNLQGIQIILSK